MNQDKATQLGVTTLSLLALASVASVVYLLSRDPTATNAVVIGGLSGAATSSVATLVRRGGMITLKRSVASNGSLTVLAPALGGFAAGTFSLIVGEALLSGANEMNMAGAAVHGGLYGLLLGGWINGALSPPEDETHATIASAALAEIGILSTGRRYNYSGVVSAHIERIRHTSLVFGTVVVEFNGGQMEGDSARVTRGISSGRQRHIDIDDGIDAEEVPFDLTLITPDALDAFPRSLSMRVPRTGKGYVTEFTLARARPVTMPEEGQAPALIEAPGTDSHEDETFRRGDDISAVLLELSQAGRSLLLLEIPVPTDEPA